MIEELVVTADELRNTVETWCKENKVDLGRYRWMTPEEWNERGERFSGGTLTLVTESGTLWPILNMQWVCWVILDENAERLYEDFYEMLGHLGYYAEISYGCFVHLCPL